MASGNAPSGGPARRSKAEQTERNWEIYQKRVRYWTLERIAREYGLTASRVGQIVDKIVEQRRLEMVDGYAEFIAKQRIAEFESLAAQEAEIWKIIEKRHYVISAGQVVSIPKIDPETGDMVVTADGDDVVTALEDDGPILAAINGALDKIHKRRAALLGLDAPTKVETTGTYNYTVNGIDPEAMK